MSDWQRLSPRMLMVHPVHEVLHQLPLLISSLVVGSATGNPVWSLLGVGFIVAFGLTRWFTTTYRIDSDEVQLRTGVLQRKTLSMPRNRIRSVQTDARLLHRLLGLTVLRVGTGQEAHGGNAFELDAVEADQVPRLRATLLIGSGAPVDAAPLDAAPVADPGIVLARWRPSWLRYSPLSWSGLVTIAAGFALITQGGVGEAFGRSRIARAWVDTAERFGAAASVLVAVAVVVVASALLAVGRSLLTFGNLVLTRVGHNLHLTHGLVRLREHTYDMRRLRGGTLRESLLVRALGGARLDAVMTGVAGAGEAALLLPPCPADTARGVLAGLVGNAEVVTGPLHPHGPAAARRRWIRAIAGPAILVVGLVIAAAAVGVPVWVWPVWAVLTVGCALMAVDRVCSLGHRVADGWLAAQQGSLERRRDCIETAGIIGWTVRQTFFQRRAGVATLIAATAAGAKHYRVVDVPADLAWAVAAQASPWVTDSIWANRRAPRVAH